MIIKNTDPYKLKKCISCKKDIEMQEKYFTYPLSLQCICLNCSLKQIQNNRASKQIWRKPKIIKD